MRHFTGTVYRNPYWPTFILLEITQGCTHNRCKFCNMYRDVQFRMSPLEWVEEDLREIAAKWPHAKTIQLLSANPLALTYDRLAPRLELIRKYLPEIEFTHHTSSANLNCNDFQANKATILTELQYDIDNMNLDMLAEIRAAKKTL